MTRSVLLVLCLAGMAQAAPAKSAAEQMGTCLVMNTTGAERLTLVRWIVISISAHSSVSDIIQLRDGAIDSNQGDFAALVTDLLTVRCRAETRAAFMAEGTKAFELAFEALGKAAVQEAMADPAVSDRMMGFATKLDEAKLKSVISP